MYLELLSPARNLDIGIAAIDSGADAVYIGGPFFGARKDAGNSVEDIAALCAYAHKFGARIFVTVNIVVSEDELPELHAQMLASQAAGVDAFIVRDERIFGWQDITVPLHASTQCAIRTPDDARRYEALGASRLVLERELSLDEVRAIRAAVGCELECFVHGALCVCYSGDCRLSEYLDGRSADRGECIQACRSNYDLVAVGPGTFGPEDFTPQSAAQTAPEGAWPPSGRAASDRRIAPPSRRGAEAPLLSQGCRILVRDKALLSLKDFNLYSRMAELADAGVCSFKIEGRLKSASYVRNVTRAYSQALDALCERSSGEGLPAAYHRASFGRISGGFNPDLSKTFNRGYTELFLDGQRSRGWSSMDAPANLGSFIGTVRRIRRDRAGLEITLSSEEALNNGDGFAFIRGSEIVGFRGDVCEGNTIRCKSVDGLREGTRLYRNIDAAFERELSHNLPKREIAVSVSAKVTHASGKWDIALTANSEDGRIVTSDFKADVEGAENRQRAAAMFRDQLSKRSGHYNFSLDLLDAGPLPLLSAGILNSMRRLLAEDLDAIPCGTIPLENRVRPADQPTLLTGQPGFPAAETQISGTTISGTPADLPAAGTPAPQIAISPSSVQPIRQPLMRSRYCIRYELGLCPVHQGAKDTGPLFLLNNGRRLALGFDCSRCEMTVSAAE